jgi:hypothetical protein
LDPERAQAKSAEPLELAVHGAAVAG